MRSHIKEPLAAAVRTRLADWTQRGNSRRLWARDASLWTGADEARWLGWLSITGDERGKVDRLNAIAADVRAAGFSHALLIGMGGSSLCPEVLRLTFGRIDGAPDFHVLDSTDPVQVAATEAAVDLANTIVIVSSKSGSTIEPNILLEYFFDRVQKTVGPDQAGRRIIAVTDPGSSLEQLATERGFRYIVHGVPQIGGRYSALSAFGLVPAAVMGINVGRFLDRASAMVDACSAGSRDEENPGVLLGATLGELALQGRDKLTIIASPAIFDLGAWLEQLVGESTGKSGKGIVPIALEAPVEPALYGHDRVFVYVRFEPAADAAQDAAVSALAEAGHPVVRLSMADVYDIGQEFFRWEIATAVAGAIIGINPFDQPDVEASKIETRRLTDAYAATGSLPAETAIVSAGPLSLFTDPVNAATLAAGAGAQPTVVAYLRAHFARASPGDYAAILAYLPMTAANQAQLQETRTLVLDRCRIATCLGFGPRFLHSTGQIYKGGPASGVFLQVTCEDAVDLPVPGRAYTFGVVKAAQARGDFQVLADRSRRALRVHLRGDVAAGLRALHQAVDEALGSR